VSAADGNQIKSAIDTRFRGGNPRRNFISGAASLAITGALGDTALPEAGARTRSTSGDGVTDDSPAIQAATDAGGGVIWLPAGDYHGQARRIFGQPLRTGIISQPEYCSFLIRICIQRALVLTVRLSKIAYQ
jgi:hypothetical protein